ncbi:GNAT family N-acetyltransferase [Puerhibacterium puerhi]|uniref:GNAT family N-acetyltransferase n=1 Tax=Puerhibacterium puerhi TaxID=2692623 RepID=UPI00135B0648|nr:GNAT family N-acetyltransferase [Puerhibacterium puerhi]
MTPFIRPATADDLPAAARTLAAAFVDYPWTRWAVPADEHVSRLEQLQALYLGHALRHGVVLVDADVRAVAAFLPPDAPEPEPATQERVAELHGDRLRALAALELPAPPERSWSLATLGVHPDHRGRGLGTAVAAAGLDMIDSTTGGAAVSLETSDERNVRLYERLGFTVTGRTAIDGGPDVCSMTRVGGTRG